MTDAAPDWAALPADALYLISSLLSGSAVDYIRFRSVCSSWRSAAPRHPQLPWLVGHHVDAEDGHQTALTLSAFRSCGSSFLFSALPEFPELGAACFGSSHGWLALFSRCLSFFLLWNPVTGVRIHLPPTARLCPNKLILSADPATSSDWTALLSHDGWGRLSIFRSRDKSWTPVKTPPHFESWSVDLVFFKGRFYVGAAHRIYVCDLRPPARAERVLPTNPRFGRTEFVGGHRIQFPDQCFLVESADDLLLVTLDATMADTYCTEVFRLDWVENRVKLSSLGSLGERALFVGRNQSFSVSANSIPGCKRNCIYLAEFYKMNMSMVRTIHIPDNTNELIFNSSVNAPSNWKPSAWLTPNLL